MSEEEKVELGVISEDQEITEGEEEEGWDLEDSEEEEPNQMSFATTPNKWLSGETPLATKRTDEEATAQLSSCKKEIRNTLKTSDLTKLQRDAEKGLEDKFALFNATNLEETKSFQSLYSVTMRIDSLLSHLIQYDMHEIFTIPVDFEENGDGDLIPKSDSKSVNLLSDYKACTLDDVKGFFRVCGHPWTGLSNPELLVAG